MGLAAASEVPPSYPVLTNAELVVDAAGPSAETTVVEASGIGTVLFSSILARHGTRVLELEAARHLTTAFIIVSAQPVSDDFLSRVASWADGFGNHAQVQYMPAFEVQTGGRATLSAHVGQRRTPSEPIAPVGTEHVCRLLDQDCGPGLGCYLTQGGKYRCALAGSRKAGESCGDAAACGPGFGCYGSGTAHACAMACEPVDTTHPKACAKVCTTNFTRIVDPAGKVLGGFCSSGA